MTCWSCSARIRRAPMCRARTQTLLLLPAYNMHRCCCHSWPVACLHFDKLSAAELMLCCYPTLLTIGSSRDLCLDTTVTRPAAGITTHMTSYISNPPSCRQQRSPWKGSLPQRRPSGRQLPPSKPSGRRTA